MTTERIPEDPTMGSETFSKRVVRDEPGATEIHLEAREVLCDGPMRVECWWSEEDAAYIAQLTDTEPESRPFTATHTGIGATREEALAHLAVAEYVLALSVATPTPPTGGEPDAAAAERYAHALIAAFSDSDVQEAVESVAVSRAYLALRTEVVALREDKVALMKLIGELADTGDCRYDHHGYCQSHKLDPKPCPHERASALLDAARASQQEGGDDA